MASKVTFRVNHTEFDRALRAYMRTSHRDLVTIVNTKAFYIARRAVIETPAVSAGEIREFIRRDEGRIIGMIINKRRGAAGQKGLYGLDMAKMVATVKAARLRSRAFLKSGWLWAIKKLAPYAERIGGGAPRGAKLFGQAKGDAVPALGGSAWRVRAQIINTVSAAWDERDGAARVAVPALQRAFDHEARTTLEYVERKLKDGARRAGIRTR